MSFLSLEFILVFTFFLIIYWLLANKPKIQNGLILLGSYAFISSFSLYATLVLFAYSTLIYILSLLSHKIRKKHFPVYLLLLLICIMFFLFKYYDAIREFVLFIGQFFGFNLGLPLINLALPIGLSFYLFHSVSLIVEQQKNTRLKYTFFQTLTYLSFFPSLVAGPINRVNDTKHQPGLMSQLLSSEYRKMIEPKRAFIYILMATFKLWVLSSYLDEWFVNDLFSTPANSSTLTVLIGLYAYAFQIYFNFSGYSELVLGLGMLLGFRLPLNFKNPYIAENLKQFWDRWHISLSLFIRDFIYIPLGGSRSGFLITQLNVLIAMTISGIWHGAGLTFLFWGILHGVGQIITNCYSRLIQYRIEKKANIAKALATFEISKELPVNSSSIKENFFAVFVTKNFYRLLTFHFICVTWIFFRANSFSDAIAIVEHLFIWDQSALADFNFLTICIIIATILFYPSIVKMINAWIEKLVFLNWKYFVLILILLMQFVIYIAPSGVPGFIYASF
ncbi:MBOAT family O-acyltransferase [Thorsellia kenyensis]|uniref:Probable alginate O-acetylase n=1 Tax=Thorsellia kenyensis TaxID=1549888 RepID=A0ABV6CF94_9GAMM